MALEKEVLESAEFKAAVKTAVSTEVAGLTQNRNDLLGEKKALREKLDAYGGLDAEEAKTLAAAKKTAEEEAAKKSGDYDTLEAKLKTEHAGQIEQIAKERDDALAGLEHEMIEKAAIEGITEAGGFLKLLKPHVVGHMKLEKTDDGKYRTVILDDKGQPRLKKGADSTGDLMSPTEFVATLKDDDEFAHAFQGSGASGGAANNRVERGGESGSLTKKADEGVKFI